MSLQEKINKDFIEAYKSHNEETVSVLRMLKSELKNAEISQKSVPSDETVIQTIKHQVKQHKDAILIYENSDKVEAKAKEEAEIKILEQYLPQQLSEDETKKIVEKVILELNAVGPNDMGKVIGKAMSEHKGEIDGSLVSKYAKELLTK